MKHSEKNCIVPCKGIYADVTMGAIEDLYTKNNFKSVLDKYKEYKAGFMKDQGRQIVLSSNHNLNKTQINFTVAVPWFNTTHQPTHSVGKK